MNFVDYGVSVQYVHQCAFGVVVYMFACACVCVFVHACVRVS